MLPYKNFILAIVCIVVLVCSIVFAEYKRRNYVRKKEPTTNIEIVTPLLYNKGDYTHNKLYKQLPDLRPIYLKGVNTCDAYVSDINKKETMPTKTYGIAPINDVSSVIPGLDSSFVTELGLMDKVYKFMKNTCTPNLVMDYEDVATNCTVHNGKKFCYKGKKSSSGMFIMLRKFYDQLIVLLPDGDRRTKRLHKFDIDKTLFEVDHNNNNRETSYTVNKGTSMGLCVRQRSTGELVSEDDMKFVFLHELGHVISESTGHNEEFWTNFRWLLSIVYNAGLMPIVDYKKNPKKYCGLTITSNVYVDS